MIVDSSVVWGWIKKDKYGSECVRLREKFESGTIRLRTTDFVKHEVLNNLARENISSNIATQLAKLLDEYLRFLCEDMTSEMVAESVGLSKRLNIELSVSSCIILSNQLGEMYVTADENLAELLQSKGFLVRHVSKLH